jgi:rRNA small subunit pseudouridine methyltransferase Nep1
MQKHARERGKDMRFIILDRSYHHSSMKKLKLNEKRGRPDIIHLALLEALGSPLNKERLLTVYVHTFKDYVIEVNPATRLPRNCNRFVSLMEQLFEFGRIPPKSTETPLLTLRQQKLGELMRTTRPSYVLALTRTGTPKTIEATVSELAGQENLTILIGGFPAGHFSEATLSLADSAICIDNEMLETWTVVSRVIYEYERKIGLPTRRLTE